MSLSGEVMRRVVLSAVMTGLILGLPCTLPKQNSDHQWAMFGKWAACLMDLVTSPFGKSNGAREPVEVVFPLTSSIS